MCSVRPPAALCRPSGVVGRTDRRLVAVGGCSGNACGPSPCVGSSGRAAGGGRARLVRSGGRRRNASCCSTFLVRLSQSCATVPILAPLCHAASWLPTAPARPAHGCGEMPDRRSVVQFDARPCPLARHADPMAGGPFGGSRHLAGYGPGHGLVLAGGGRVSVESII